MKNGWTVVAVLATAVGLAAGEARAQVYGMNSTDMIAYQSGLRIDRNMLAGPLASTTRSVRMDGTGMQTGPEVREINLLGSRSGLMMEMARVTPDGQFVRPRLLIGRHSDELRNWMHSVGISADRCMLPLVRGRLKRAPETGKTGAAFLVSARCSFY
jgi:hypothetical protein